MVEQAQTMDLFPFDNSYARLPDRFFARLPPTPVAAPRLVRLNEALARHLRLDPDYLASPNGVAVLAGNRVPRSGEPLAMAYAGHQFGYFVPQLGDGRAILLGEVVDVDGVRRDIQLKGSGPTPFSRSGDGRAALGPVLREYIVSEAMAALGIPTTSVARCCRNRRAGVARNAAARCRPDSRRVEPHPRRHLPVLRCPRRRGCGSAISPITSSNAITRKRPRRLTATAHFSKLVIARQADLIAQWLLVGFIHGVMNTDNMSIAGETIDYGPCAFMDTL